MNFKCTLLFHVGSGRASYARSQKFNPVGTEFYCQQNMPTFHNTGQYPGGQWWLSRHDCKFAVKKLTERGKEFSYLRVTVVAPKQLFVL